MGQTLPSNPARASRLSKPYGPPSYDLIRCRSFPRREIQKVGNCQGFPLYILLRLYEALIQPGTLIGQLTTLYMDPILLSTVSESL
jgi:hypothetical protein